MSFSSRSLVARATDTSLAAGVRTAVVQTGTVVLVAAITAIGAHIRIPLEPVPITLQTLFVLLAGAWCGPARGALGQTVYVAGGVLGIPLLAGSTVGFAVLAGPTGGYLAGFVVAAWLVGRLIERRSGFAWHVLVFSAASLLILLLGVLHLALFTTGDLSTAFRVGFLPFVPGDAAKILAAASIYGSYKRLRAHNPAA